MFVTFLLCDQLWKKLTKMRGLFLLTCLEVSVHGQLDLLILKCSSQAQDANRGRKKGWDDCSNNQSTSHWALPLKLFYFPIASTCGARLKFKITLEHKISSPGQSYALWRQTWVIGLSTPITTMFFVRTLCLCSTPMPASNNTSSSLLLRFTKHQYNLRTIFESLIWRDKEQL